MRPADFVPGLLDGLGGGDAGLGFELSHRPCVVPREGRDRASGLLGDVEVRLRPSQAPVPPEGAAHCEEEPERAEAVAERERRYREIFGVPEPQRRRLWRR